MESKTRLLIFIILSLGFTMFAQGTELSLPIEIKNLKFVDRTEYDDKKLGYSLRYETEKLLKADIYVYNKGLDLTDGINSPEIKNELATVEAILQHFEQLGKYNEVKAEKNGKKQFGESNIEFLWSRHSYKEIDSETFKGKRVSDTFLIIHQGSFIKVRITTKQVDFEAHKEQINALMHEIAQQIKNSQSTPSR